MVTFKCTPAYGEALRSLYPEAVARGYHCPPVQQPHWNTVLFREEITDALWTEMADHAYQTVIAKLPRKVREEIGGMIEPQ